jgi:hypothetical protein
MQALRDDFARPQVGPERMFHWTLIGYMLKDLFIMVRLWPPFRPLASQQYPFRLIQTRAPCPYPLTGSRRASFLIDDISDR